MIIIENQEHIKYLHSIYEIALKAGYDELRIGNKYFRRNDGKEYVLVTKEMYETDFFFMLNDKMETVHTPIDLEYIPASYHKVLKFLSASNIKLP